MRGQVTYFFVLTDGTGKTQSGNELVDGAVRCNSLVTLGDFFSTNERRRSTITFSSRYTHNDPLFTDAATGFSREAESL